MICRSGTVNATDTTITSNSANNIDGGGISLGGEGVGTLNAENLLVSGNTAGRNGGGIFINGTFNTNNHIWSDLSAKENNFSVDSNGTVKAYDDNLDVRISSNVATIDPFTNQMGKF
jgi:hypothetical protein